jgi:hypothetical protein
VAQELPERTHAILEDEATGPKAAGQSEFSGQADYGGAPLHGREAGEDSQVHKGGPARHWERDQGRPDADDPVGG